MAKRVPGYIHALPHSDAVFLRSGQRPHAWCVFMRRNQEIACMLRVSPARSRVHLNESFYDRDCLSSPVSVTQLLSRTCPLRSEEDLTTSSPTRSRELKQVR